MINLMPQEMKTTLVYARRNLVLVKWLAAVFVGLVGIGAVIMAGNFYVDHSTKLYAREVESRKTQLSAMKLEETKKRTEEISGNIRLALQVLSRQVIFSELLKQIGAVMPTGSSLQSLSINRLEGGLDLQAIAVDYQTGTQVQVNITDPANKIFEKADIISISCQTENLSNPKYPCLVSIRALFAKDSPFVFTNTTKQGASQ
jgi:hypothetical protein